MSVCVGCQGPQRLPPGIPWRISCCLLSQQLTEHRGSSRWVWLALYGREGVKGRQLRLPLHRRRARERKAGERGKTVCGGQTNEWLQGSEWGIRHMSVEVSIFPAIGATPGLVLIGQDASPNPSLVLLSVWSPLSSIQRCGEWTKAEDEKGASLWGLIQLHNC